LFRFNSLSELENKYMNNLTITQNANAYRILDIRLKEENINKGVFFMEKLIEVFQTNNLEKKNQYASNTIEFIQTQLGSISDSLEVSENEMISFQTRNRIIDVSAQGQQLLEKINDLERVKVESYSRKSYYQYLKTALANPEVENVIAPSAMGINDPVISSMIAEFNQISMERAEQFTTVKNPKHLNVRKINARMETLKSNMKVNLDALLEQSDKILTNIQDSISEFEQKVFALPKTERDFVNLEREFNLTNSTYTFLLQRLSEAQIAKASNTSDYELVEHPIQVGGLIEPQPRKIYSTAVFLGLLAPAVLFLLLMLLNNKVQSQEEIEAITTYPVIGHVFHNDREYASRRLVLDKPNSPASEPYRAIRNKLNLMTKGKKHPVIAITSTFPKEGKSYNAINIASSFALMRKKTALLDLDLRNSKMIEEFNLNSELGVVNYIIGKASLEEITYETKHPLLKLLPAGPIPPNPAEMLTDKNLTELIEKLKKTYDIVIVDTPPVGFVADLFHLNETIDSNLYIVRHKYTHKQGLKVSLQELERHQMKGVGIIINNIQRGKRNYGFGTTSYGYGYSYGYGHPYKDDKNKSKRGHLDVSDI